MDFPRRARMMPMMAGLLQNLSFARILSKVEQLNSQLEFEDIPVSPDLEDTPVYVCQSTLEKLKLPRIVVIGDEKGKEYIICLLFSSADNVVGIFYCSWEVKYIGKNCHDPNIPNRQRFLHSSSHRFIYEPKL